jgi:hypothetical protein
MSPNKISVEHDGKIIEGKINVRDKFDMEVEITKPYVKYLKHSGFRGPGRQTPHHFLTEYGDKRAKEFLIEIYKKLKIIDESIDRIVRLYDQYLEEVSITSVIEKVEFRDGINSKLQDWFFSCLFTPSVTGLVASIVYDRDKIIEIIEVYKKEKRKLYLSSSPEKKRS